MEKQKPRFCSLDIETSGFDPLINEVLEVGFAFFELTEKGIKITEEFTQVFKPTKEVAPAIFGLTGITKEELDKAPDLNEYKKVIQEKLGDAVIVGHNVTFDIKFLESCGIKFSGKVVDTLELVQFILPTHHSYNLENLMHVFKVAHKEAHRALADAKATLVVLERLLRLYSGYPTGLKKQVSSLIKPLNFLWEGFLQTKLAPTVFSPPVQPHHSLAGRVQELALKPKHIYDFALGENYLNRTLTALKDQTSKALLVVPKEPVVLELWKAGLVEPVFASEVTFDEQKFDAFLEKSEKSPEETKFLLKVLVWKYTNWQHECLLDLNLSFFGGQFRQMVAGGKAQEKTKPKLLCCSLDTFCKMSEAGWYKKRLVIMDGLADFEQHLSSGLTAKVGWGYVLYLLKSIYNPELDTGNKKLKSEVLETLSSTDLFFGLAGAFFQDDPTSFQYVKMTESLAYSEKFQKLAKAAQSYSKKLEEFAALSRSEEIRQAACGLQEFFALQPGKVHWLELAEKRCVFFSAPLDISGLAKKILAGFAKVAFVDSLGSGKILTYYSSRLGLKDFEKTLVGPVQPTLVRKSEFMQGDLFSTPAQTAGSLKGAVATVTKKSRVALPTVSPAAITCHYLAKPVLGKELASLLTAAELPAAALLGTVTQVREFYDGFYQGLQQKARLLANTHSGGGNKLFHNFFIDKNSILLATDKFILKSLSSTNGLELVKHLPVKTLVLGHLPFEQFAHPYQEALTSQFANSFLDYSLPKAIYNLHRILQFFYTSSLENLYIWDAKLAKGYAQDFKDYLQGLPGVRVVEE